MERLSQALELHQSNAQLPQNLEKKRRPDLAPTVQRDRHRTPVRMNPSLVTASLPGSNET
jgi:hypothetical protein